MKTAALLLAERARSAGEPERLTYGPVELAVADLDRTTAFWTRALGFVPRPHPDPKVQALGTATQTLVILHPGARTPVQQGRSGLYHVAFGVPDQREFSRLLARLLSHQVRIAAVDHVMSKALYLWDPNGLGIEIAFETPERFGRFGSFTNTFSLYDAQGRLRSGRDPLDVSGELKALDGADPAAPVAAGTAVAHLHLHVPDLARAVSFYEGVGFAANLFLPHLGFADLGAGGPYTHRIAVNTWQGERVEPASSRASRLLRYQVRVVDPTLLERARQSPDARESDGGLDIVDPTGTVLRLCAASDAPTG